jgi:hypothetical protein
MTKQRAPRDSGKAGGPGRAAIARVRKDPVDLDAALTALNEEVFPARTS